ncbi:MAG: ABC transporter permease, partial [Bacteroidota bacterium]|nr:ABC transporter permease [Bacteroidota bacterium]
MLRNYFKIAWRNLLKNKLYSLVNIGGLTTGITCCLLIGLYLQNETSYDRFHKNAGRIVRATTEYTINGTVNQMGKTGSMAGPRLSQAFPQIESFVRILNFEPYAVMYGEKSFVENRFDFADSNFFQIFSFPLLEGDPSTALKGPLKIVITQQMERKYFGEGKALGKILKVGGTRDFMVSGVAANVPANSQIQFDFIASYASLRNANNLNWGVEIYATYFLLRPNTDIKILEKEIAGYMKNQKDLDQAGNDYLIFHMEPMTKVHLYSTLEGLEPNGNITYLYILVAVAILIVCIASVNYTNLSIAQAVHRIPEIGIRKVLGSARRQLFWQFIGESMLLNILSFSLAVCLSILLLPYFNNLVGRTLDIRALLNPLAIGIILMFYLIISIASGMYPAFVLSGLKLIKILKAGFSFTGNSGIARRSLIVFQFAVSVFLIISTVLIFQQLSFIQHKDLGYDKDHVLVLPADALVRRNYQSLKEAISRVPGVMSVSCGAEETTNINWDDEINISAGYSNTSVSVNASPTDIDFVKTMGVHIVSGTDFTQADWQRMDLSYGPANWQTAYMLNESAAKAMGWTPEQAIGKIIYRSGQKGTIKAVLKDFNYAPLHQPIRPLVVFLDSNYYHIYQVFVKVSNRNLPVVIQGLGDTWRARVSHRPFQYHFLDDNFNRIYHNEQQTAEIFSTFSSLAILLACLGLFALAAYTTVQRAKEIGIRKILGAGVREIVLLISQDFIRLVVIASLIAFPLAWFSANSWLDQFAYRIQINWLVFFIAGITATFIALA